MSKIKISLLKISLFLVFTQGLWERLFFYSPMIEAIVEISIILFIVYPVNSYLKKSPGYIQFLLLIFIGIIVGIGNESGLINWFKYMRYLFYFYLIYNQLWNNPISSKKWLGIYKFIAFLIIIQGLGAFVNIFILNQRVEGYVGLMSSSGGTTATSFPLLIISICLLLWFFNKKKNRKLDLILFIILFGSMLVGYSSSKRGIFFLIPVFVLIVSVVSGFKLYLNFSFYKKLFTLGAITILMAPIFVYGIITSHGLNYGLSGNESKLGVIQNAIQYALVYETSESEFGETTGRSNTTKAVIASSLFSRPQFFFGNGYGSIKDEGTKFTLGIGYGVVGFTRDIISAGWLVMILTFLIFLNIFIKNESNYIIKLDRSLKIVIVLIFVFIHFGYSSDFVVSLKISFLIAIIFPFFYSKVHSNAKRLILERSFY